MKNIVTPLLNGLMSPFIGSQAPEHPPGDPKPGFMGRKISLANLKSPFLSLKPSFGDFKSPFLGHKLSIPVFEGLKSPFPGQKAPDSSLSNAKSPFPGFSIFKSLKSPFVGHKDPDVTNTPVPVPVPVPVPERQHIPPYHHLVDCEVGFYDRLDMLDAFMSSLPNLPGGYRYREISKVPGFGEPHLLGVPVNVRFQIYQILTKSVRAKNKKVVLSPDRTIDWFWPKKHFMEPEAIFNIIGGLSLTCFQLRHEIMTYYCSQFHFHITYNYFCSPIAAPLIHNWLPLFGNRMQYLTVEVDFTRVGGCYKNDKFALTDGQTEIMWFIKKLTLALRDRSGHLRSLHIMCRRYKGFRPPSQKRIPENIPDDTETPTDETPEDETPEDETPSDSDTPESNESQTKSKKPRNKGLLKYCPSDTTVVLNILPKCLGRSGVRLYHFRLSGFSKVYTEKILTEVGTVGRGPPLLTTPEIPPWPRDYPEIGIGITTTDGNYLGTVVKVVNNYVDTYVGRPPTGKMAARKTFLRRAISRISIARTTPLASTTPNMERSEIFTPYPEYDQLSTIDDSDVETITDTVRNNQNKTEGLGLGIQLPIRHNKYPLLQKSQIEEDIERQLEEPDLPKEVPVEVNELWAIDAQSTRFGDLFGVSTATRGVPKELRKKPPGVDSMHTALGLLYPVPEEQPAGPPSISVRAATVPNVQERLQEINATSSTLFDPPAPVQTGSWNGINRLPWNLGRVHEDFSQLGLHTVATNSTFYTDASESTLDMAYGDLTIPPETERSAHIHEQEVDSSTTLYLPEDDTEMPAARNSNEELGQVEELWDRGQEQPDLSQLGLHTVATSSTLNTESTRSRSNTDGSEILDWPLSDPTIPTLLARPPPPVPAPVRDDDLHQIATSTSRRTLRFADEEELTQIPTAPSRRTARFSDTDNLHEIPTSSSRRTVQFAETKLSEAEERERRARSASFSAQKNQRQKTAEGFNALNSMFDGSMAPEPMSRRERKEKKEKKKENKRSKSRSGRLWGKGKPKQDAEDNSSQPGLRAASGFASNADESETPYDRAPTPLPKKLKNKRSKPKLNLRRSISQFLHPKKPEEPEEPEESEESEKPEDVDDMYVGLDLLYNGTIADVPALAGGEATHPLLRSVQSISFLNPLKLFRSTSSMQNTELPNDLTNEMSYELSELSNELSDELTNELSNDPSNELSNDPSNDPSAESTDPATAPTPEHNHGLFCRIRRRISKSHLQTTDVPATPSVPSTPEPSTLSRLLKRNKKPAADAAEIEATSSHFSLMINGSSVTVGGGSITNTSAEYDAEYGSFGRMDGR
ncbi:hypothetical protein V502_04253 [Pseudogymnoascus sp. VKM F-4520 (FW-2644)]|nr:hypothetical protein V502_04253 [Pseudogymnoascus sp. VKM F-4520 (FW-2644)]